MLKDNSISVTVGVGRRFYSEFIDVHELKEHYDEAEFIGGKPSWKRYTRPITCTEKQLSKLRNHFLIGWVESTFQSDASPFFCLTEYNPEKKWVYIVENYDAD